METYHKIQTLFKRHLDGPKKGKMIRGDWTTSELEYLAGNDWQFTEKLDGTNIRVGYTGHGVTVFKGRSDNAQIPEHLINWLIDNLHPSVFERAGFTDEVTLYGEGLGPKIQGSGKYSESGRDYKFVLFDVKIGDWWLRRADVNDVAEKLGIEYAPVIGNGTLHDAIDIVSTGLTWDARGHMTNWGGHDDQNKRVLNGLKSQWGNFEAEGIVARPVVDLFDRQGKRIITKIKAVDFR